MTATSSKAGLLLRRYQMHPEKALMEKSATKLLQKAADCFELADTQQQGAERQHEIAARQHSGADDLESSAHKLEALGHALEADAAQIQGDTEVVARGISPAGSSPALPPRSQRDGSKKLQPLPAAASVVRTPAGAQASPSEQRAPAGSGIRRRDAG